MPNIASSKNYKKAVNITLECGKIMRFPVVKMKDTIENKIITIRGFQIMAEGGMADLYEAKNRTLKQTVKRNI